MGDIFRKLFGGRARRVDGDVVGGDKIGGDKVGGDKVSGNKGDTYDIKDSPGSGRNVSMNDVNIRQSRMESGKIDLGELARELATLRAEMKGQASSPEHDVAVGAVAQAEAEANKGDESKALEYLSSAGHWALDVATKIGVPLATEVLKKSLGP
jgi:hypothetical protein